MDYETKKLKIRECWDKWEKENPEKVKEAKRRYAEKPENKERMRQRGREYMRKKRAENPEKYRKEYRIWRAKNLDKVKEATRRWRKNNPDKVRIMKKRYYERYSDKVKDRVKRWIKKNPEKKRFQSSLRAMRRKEAEGKFTYGEWERLKKQYGFRCPSCGRCEPEIHLTIDHIIPLVKGGSNWIENIQPLCKECNCKKHTQIKKFNPLEGATVGTEITFK